MMDLDIIIKRMQKKSTRTANGCLEYQGGRNQGGYGLIGIRVIINNPTKRKQRCAQVHRVAYHYFIDNKIPIWRGNTKLEIDHKCRNHSCWEPKHLRAVTHRKNIILGKTSKLNKSKKSKYVGVSWSKPMNKWRARIYYDKYNHVIGYFDSEHDAAKAYQQALRSLKK